MAPSAPVLIAATTAFCVANPDDVLTGQPQMVNNCAPSTYGNERAAGLNVSSAVV